LKTIIKKKVESKNFYKIFKPQLTPRKMLQLGVFGSSYFKGKIKEYPRSWFKNAKITLFHNVEM